MGEGNGGLNGVRKILNGGGWGQLDLYGGEKKEGKIRAATAGKCTKTEASDGGHAEEARVRATSIV